MKKILVFSDSHGNINNIARIITLHKDIDIIIHLGDYVRDVLRIGKENPNREINFVGGNNDWAYNYPTEKTIEVCSKKIFITHGHIYKVKQGLTELIEKGKQLNVDLICFGHTHCSAEVYEEGMMLINPGSINISVNQNKSTYCILEISNEKIISKLHSII